MQGRARRTRNADRNARLLGQERPRDTGDGAISTEPARGTDPPRPGSAATAGAEHKLHIGRRMGLGSVAGVAVGAVVPSVPGDLIARILIGFCVAAVCFAVPLLVRVMRADAATTKALVSGRSSEQGPTDVAAVSAAVASLAGIAQMLVASSSANSGFEAVVALGTVATAWLVVHTTYAVRYARHYYNAEPGSVDFNTRSEPRFSDFAYLAFTLGMTYQVSDTDVRTPALRKVILFHTLLSYVFGTGIIAATINLVAGASK